MPEKWTGEVKKQQHIHGISMMELAAEAGMNPKYLSTVLHSESVAKPTREKIESALKRAIALKREEKNDRTPET